MYSKSSGFYWNSSTDIQKAPTAALLRPLFQGNLLEPKKGKTVGSAADMTIEYLIDILTYIFV